MVMWSFGWEIRIEIQIEMAEKSTCQPTLKKLMQIIYDKEKEVDKYRKQLRQKQRNTKHQHHNPQSHPKSPQGPILGLLTMEEKDYITMQIVENKRILQNTTKQLYGMEARIQELQADLGAEESRNLGMQGQVEMLRAQVESRDEVIRELTAAKELLENMKINKTGELSEKEIKIQQLLLQNKKLKLLSDQTKQENQTLKQRLHQLETTLTKQFRSIQKNIRNFHKPGLSQVDLNSKGRIDLNSNSSNISVQPLSQKYITDTYVCWEKNDASVQDRLVDFVSMMTKWAKMLTKREEDWRRNFERGLADHSIDGISGLISHSAILAQDPIHPCPTPNPPSLQNNESQFLHKLQEECQKQLAQQQAVEKQQQIQLQQVKQSLRMTKQINEQLFDEINKQEGIIKMFKQTFKSLEAKKGKDGGVGDQLRKLRDGLGIRF